MHTYSIPDLTHDPCHLLTENILLSECRHCKGAMSDSLGLLLVAKQHRVVCLKLDAK